MQIEFKLAQIDRFDEGTCCVSEELSRIEVVGEKSCRHFPLFEVL